MLEFQKGFFEREIRENFYVDATMKAVWAAEMEVLQRVAEVCDKYGIIWYAAYGTLLGAIRHEGFIPWDDDLDIWVRRADYNRLMQILPQELPQGYRVRCPITEIGYDEYHTCISNGRVITINREWLEQYHGCPFSVGLDIFPLDYLPREETERVVQENAFFIAMNCARFAMSLEGDKTEAPAERQSAMEQIVQGVDYLEENMGARIERRFVEAGNWEKVASELWKWANYIAMMYGEEESDYLVNYVDYARWPQKKFPKEWFAEAYSATFENFMLPVPCEYDLVLRKIYGNYEVCHRGGGTHDYPFYEEQLEAAQKLLKQCEEAVGSSEEERITPANWRSLLFHTDGARKKIVLFVNDINDFVMYGENAMDKLESVLHIFYEAREKVLLWWRPQAEMPHALALADRLVARKRQDSAVIETEAIALGLTARYNTILEKYKAESWGICDESNDKLRAVEICDAYYGAENRLVKKFQNSGKPIMIASGR